MRGWELSDRTLQGDRKVDRLELALRRYQQILPQPKKHARMPLRDLNVWLTEDVNAVLEDYTSRPAFREHASWSIRELSNGSPSSGRVLVDRIDTEFVNCGRALLKLASNQLVERHIVKNVSKEPVVVGETVQIDDAGTRRISVEFGESCELEVERSQIRAIAERNGTDLVNVNDYFEPQQEWTQDCDGQRLQLAAGIVSINPELLPVGDFVVRRLIARVKMRVDVLSSLRQRCLSALQQVRPPYRKDRTKVEEAWSQLSETSTALVRMLRTGVDCRLRDACVVATQIYAACHPHPNVTWLGLDPCVVDRALPMLRSRFTGLHNDHYFDRIAAALGSLRLLYDDESPNRSAIEEAIASGGLVIVQVRREVFWQAQKLKEQPTGSAWKLLLALASKAPSRAVVEVRDVWGDEAVSDSAMSTAWGRLKKCLPPSLWRLVRPGEERRTYSLHLDALRTHLFS